MVVKNLAKDPLYYTKNGEFGTKGVGYTTEAPGLGEPKEPKGKYKSSGYGDLDYYNGRYCVTPEYPSGTYAYFIAVNSSYVPQYPYIIGPSYYGTPITTQTGTISETVTTYYSYSSGK